MPITSAFMELAWTRPQSRFMTKPTASASRDLGLANILPRYVSDTAGDMMAEFDRQGIEQAYAKIADTARNQYTLGYTTQATKSSSFRTIDVRVLRPNLNVFAKQGYYPLPPQPLQPKP